MCTKSNTHAYVARTSNNRVIAAGDLYRCFLPQCEALRTCCLGFPIATKWCCDQDVKVMPGPVFTQKNVQSVWFVEKRRGCCCNLCPGVALNAQFTTNGMCAINNIIFVARTSNNRVLLSGELSYCLLPQCGALCTCRSRFPITTV